MQRLEVSGAVRPIYGSLGVKWLNLLHTRPPTLLQTRSRPPLHTPTLMVILYHVIYCAVFSDNYIQPDDGQK